MDTLATLTPYAHGMAVGMALIAAYVLPKMIRAHKCRKELEARLARAQNTIHNQRMVIRTFRERQGQALLTFCEED